MPAALARYKILDRVGAGRIGELFRARDSSTGRTVAVRVVADEIAGHADDRRRFVEDARAAAGLSHPNVAAVYEVDDDHGRLFLASEFVPGETLRTVMASRALALRHALDLAIQLTEAVAETHAHGILHLDIRPGTIIITPTGIAKFVDVGLAAWTAGGPGLTCGPATQAVADDAPSEAVRYTSPEQRRGEPPDERADIFSLGAVLFDMLSRPRSEAVTATAVATRVPQAPSAGARNRTVPAELDALVLKMVAENPDHRYECAVTVAAELRAVAAILDVRDAAGEVSPPAVNSTGSSDVLTVVLLLVVLALVAVIVFLR